LGHSPAKVLATMQVKLPERSTERVTPPGQV